MGSGDLAGQLARLEQRPVVVASHRRSGTHLSIDLLRRQFDACSILKWPGEPLHHLYLNLDAVGAAGSAALSEEQALGILRRARCPILKTHQLPSGIGGASPAGRAGGAACWAKWIRDRACLLYVCRDGRDVMCSYHLWRLGCEPGTPADLAAFLRETPAGVSRPRAWADHVRAWRAEPGVNLLRFEDVVGSTRQVVARLAELLALTPRWRQPLCPRRVNSVWRGRLDRLCGGRPQSTALLGRPRGQVLLKWRSAFSAADRRFFHDEAGDMLVELGYESSDQWVNDPG